MSYFDGVFAALSGLQLDVFRPHHIVQVCFNSVGLRSLRWILDLECVLGRLSRLALQHNVLLGQRLLPYAVQVILVYFIGGSISEGQFSFYFARPLRLEREYEVVLRFALYLELLRIASEHSHLRQRVLVVGSIT